MVMEWSTPLDIMFMPIASPVWHLKRRYTLRPATWHFTSWSFPYAVVDSNASLRRRKFCSSWIQFAERGEWSDVVGRASGARGKECENGVDTWTQLLWNK
jgi:hypothetical protein